MAAEPLYTDNLLLPLLNPNLRASFFAAWVDAMNKLNAGDKAQTSARIAGDAATLAAAQTYADVLIQGKSIKTPARAISQTNITLSGLQTVDGVVLAVGNRVLVAGQTDKRYNGIYLDATTSWTRAPDADSSLEMAPGFLISVTEGATQQGSLWELVTTEPTNLGTTLLTFQPKGGNTAGLALAADLTAEIAARQSGDSTNAAAISAEVSTRIAAVAAVASSLATEVTARATGDQNLQASLTAEAATRAAADLVLQPLDADLTAIAALDSTQPGLIATDGAGWIRKTYGQLKTALGLSKSDFGLGNVDNTSDAAKPISTAQQAALDLKLNAALKGSANGVAELVNGTVPAAQLPSYVDDVVEADNFSALPPTGEAGKVYITLDNNQTFRWGGSSYVTIGTSLALGETSATAYRGDRGKTAYDHSQITTGNPHGVSKTDVGLGNVDNTADSAKPISIPQQAAFDAEIALRQSADSAIQASVDAIIPAEYQPVAMPAAVTISNTTTSTAIVAFTTPADTYNVGHVVQIRAFGKFVNTSGTPVTVTPTFTFGSSSFTGAPLSFPSSTIGYSWELKLQMVCHGTASEDIRGELVVDTPSGKASFGMQPSFTESLVSAKTMMFSIALGTASSLITWTQVAAYVTVIPPSPLQPIPPLWFADYGSVSAPTDTVQGVWYREQEPNNPGSTGPIATSRMSIVPQSSVPGTGLYKPTGNAMRVELQPYGENGSGDVQVSSGTEYNRAEVYDRFGPLGSTPPAQWPDPVGSERWYGFSVYIPTGHVFATDSTWFTFTQWKGQFGGSPPLALEINRQQFRFGGTQGTVTFPNSGNLGAITTDKWYLFVVGIKFATTAAFGWAQISINGTPIIARTSIRTMDTYSGDADPTYLKQGIYRSKVWNVTHVLHYSPMIVARRQVDVMNKLSSLVAMS